MFAVSTGGRGWFVGATPETLVRRRGQHIFTHALAGTTAPGDESLLDTDRMRREHEIVVRQIMNNLEPLCHHAVAAEPITVRSGPVSHRMTPIEARLRGEEPDTGETRATLQLNGETFSFTETNTGQGLDVFA